MSTPQEQARALNYVQLVAERSLEQTLFSALELAVLWSEQAAAGNAGPLSGSAHGVPVSIGTDAIYQGAMLLGSPVQQLLRSPEWLGRFRELLEQVKADRRLQSFGDELARDVRTQAVPPDQFPPMPQPAFPAPPQAAQQLPAGAPQQPQQQPQPQRPPGPPGSFGGAPAGTYGGQSGPPPGTFGVQPGPQQGGRPQGPGPAQGPQGPQGMPRYVDLGGGRR
jgi:hypothetical protein